MSNLILLRHGESLWNRENRFTGWTDVGLTEKGESQAHEAGRLLEEEGLLPEVAFTSVLRRAIKTLWIALEELDRMWIPVHRSWRLNERHYGSLQGLDKAETAERHGLDQVKVWRRSYDIPPPPLDPEDERSPLRDPRYAELDRKEVPLTESLKDTRARFLPYYEKNIVPALRSGKRVIVAAHGNSLRALVKDLDGLSEAEIVELNIPTGVPLIYDIGSNLEARSRRYLGDAEAIAAAQKAVAQQAERKK
jgi:2,3-bisphosphoglycerate-dependent phosphoglycerate mutase